MKRFFSSTFRDMENERDMLRDKMFPAINEIAHSQNDSVKFCDLRWGIDTLGLDENDAESKILNVCLEELDHSDDLMIVLLDDRYGWTVTSDQINHLLSAREIKINSKEVSATALEIEYGVFVKKKNVLVYIREFKDDSSRYSPDFYLENDDNNRAELNKLKERLYSVENCRVQTYYVHGTGGGIQKGDSDVLANMLVNYT